MKARIIFSVITAFIALALNSQIPQGFTYQALAMTSAGEPIRNQALPVRISIQSDSLGGTLFWFELHSSVTTNNSGLFTLILGKGVKQAGIANTFADIDWSVTPKFIKTEVYNGTWNIMGSSRLWSVPYALSANSLTGTLSKLEVAGKTSLMDQALFVVRNQAGDTVFAVFNEGVRINVGNGDAKGSKGGFAIGSFDETKGSVSDLMRVTRDSTRVYISNSGTKASKGGFAIGSFDESKAGPAVPFMNLTPENYLIGHMAGEAITTGKFNSFFGYESGRNNTTGTNNAFMGYFAGRANTNEIGRASCRERV